MKILITGAAGFIGSNLTEELCKNKKYKLYGIDNFSEYSGYRLKKYRLSLLKKKKNFKFKKIDINNKKVFQNYLKVNKFDIIFHFAAEVGVRYSAINPSAYTSTNIVGFFNLIETFKYHQPKKFIYASSSSVYGESKKFPLIETDKLNPKNIYALSKKNNEEISEIYSHNFKTKMIGLRFFTVFGEMGRPDMFFFKLLKSIYDEKTFYLNNSGNHYRDFTYIFDITKILKKLIHNKPNNNHSVFNICSSRPVHLNKLLNIIRKYTKDLKIKNSPYDPSDVFKTHGSNKKILKHVGKNFTFTGLEAAVKNTIEWYRVNKINKFT